MYVHGKVDSVAELELNAIIPLHMAVSIIPLHMGPTDGRCEHLHDGELLVILLLPSPEKLKNTYKCVGITSPSRTCHAWIIQQSDYSKKPSSSCFLYRTLDIYIYIYTFILVFFTFDPWMHHGPMMCMCMDVILTKAWGRDKIIEGIGMCMFSSMIPGIGGEEKKNINIYLILS